MLRTILLSLTMFTITLVYGQTSQTGRIEAVQANELDGTYQIILHDERMIPIEVTNDLLESIEYQRKQDEIVMWEYTPYVTIKILPRALVLSGNFEPLIKYAYVD